MSVPKDYNKDFPKNTRNLFEGQYSNIAKTSGLEVTFLMNCLLGLIVIIFEKYEDLIKDKNLAEFSDYLPETFEMSDSNKSQKIPRVKSNYNSINLRDFLKRMRDGIAHQNITPLPKVDEDDTTTPWKSVEIKDIFFWREDKEKKENENFNIIIEVDNLKKLAIAISDIVADV